MKTLEKLDALKHFQLENNKLASLKGGAEAGKTYTKDSYTQETAKDKDSSEEKCTCEDEKML